MRAEVDIPSAIALALEEVGCASLSGVVLMTVLLAVFSRANTQCVRKAVCRHPGCRLVREDDDILDLGCDLTMFREGRQDQGLESKRCGLSCSCPCQALTL